MTLQDVLEKENITNIKIMYRVYIEIHGITSDELFGYCEYKDGELISLDGDSYDLTDEIREYEYPYEDLDGDTLLIVWQ